MIYTLTLNPALDYNIFFDEINLGSVNRANDTEITFGGKGINVSYVLKELGVYSTALGFAAGFTGAELLTRLCKANIITNFVRLQSGLTRINVKLHTGQATDIKIQAALILRPSDNLHRILAENPGRSIEEIARDTERDNFMTAEQALEYGLIDKIFAKRA